jgi:hypothetical protein
MWHLMELNYHALTLLCVRLLPTVRCLSQIMCRYRSSSLAMCSKHVAVGNEQQY